MATPAEAQTAPFGTWDSPITAATLTSKGISFSGIAAAVRPLLLYILLRPN